MLIGQRIECACSQQSLADFQNSQVVKNLSAVQSSSKIDGQNFLILVLAVTTVYVGVTTPCCIHIHDTGGPVPDLNFPLYGHNLRAEIEGWLFQSCRTLSAQCTTSWPVVLPTGFYQSNQTIKKHKIQNSGCGCGWETSYPHVLNICPTDRIQKWSNPYLKPFPRKGNQEIGRKTLLRWPLWSLTPQLGALTSWLHCTTHTLQWLQLWDHCDWRQQSWWYTAGCQGASTHLWGWEDCATSKRSKNLG